MKEKKAKKAPKPRDMLELRLHEPATPARVARAAKLFEQLLVALGAEGDVGTTLVVENRYLKATLRTRTKRGESAANIVIGLVESPLKPGRTHPARAELASELASYGRDEMRFHPQLWRPNAEAPLVEFDAAFVATMEAIASAPLPNSQVVKGTTYVFSKVYRVGRTDERGPLRVRVNIDGRPLEVRLGDQVDRGAVYDAARNESVVRLRLDAEWLHLPDAPPSMRPNPIVVGIEPAPSSGSGARIIALAKAHNVITAEDLPQVLAAIDRDRDDEGGAE